MFENKKTILISALCTPIVASALITTALAQASTHTSLTSANHGQAMLSQHSKSTAPMINIAITSPSGRKNPLRHNTQNAALQSSDDYAVAFENDLKGIQMLYDNAGSSHDKYGSKCRDKCYTQLSAGAQQWMDIASNPAAWAAPGYSLCTSISYDATGKPGCVGYLGYVSVSLNHNGNSLKPGQDTQSQAFFKKMSFTQIPGKSIYSITSTYAPTPAPALTKPQSYTSGLAYRGVNLSGAEFGASSTTIQPPTVADGSWEAQYGVNTFRIPIRAEYALPNGTNGSVDINYINRVKATMASLLESGYAVILDLHNYMRFCPGAGAGSCTTLLTASQLQNIWSKLLTQNVFGDLASKYPNHLMLDLMNEPNGIDAATVVADYNQTITTIRTMGFSNLLLLEGTAWSGLHSWSDSGNAAAFTQISDSKSNVAINVHQYFDANYSGVGAACVDPSTLLSNIHADAFANWLKTNKLRAFVSEFGAPGNATCQKDLSTFINYLQANDNNANQGYGFIGWTLWSAGHAWADNYQMNFQGPTGVNFPLWSSLFVANQFITPVSHDDRAMKNMNKQGN